MEPVPGASRLIRQQPKVLERDRFFRSLNQTESTLQPVENDLQADGLFHWETDIRS